MSKFSRRARVAVFAVVSSACVAGVGVLAPTGALAAPSPVLLAQSGGGAVQLTGSVTDTSGVLSSDEVSRLRDQINDVAESTGVNMRVVFVPTFEGQTAKEFATNLYDAYGGQRGVIFAVATQQRDYTTVYGPGVEPEVSKQITKAATSLLSDEKWFDAASAAISAVKDTEGGGSASSADGGGIDAGGAALAGGGALAVAGGAVAYARRRRKKDDEQRLEAARSMDPADTRGLQQQDLATLRTLAAEELVSTDESIRRASEELERAREEFGPARVAQFTQALESSKVTLARAFALKQAMTPQDEHATLVQIVSMCGMADDVLDAQAEEFAQMRSVLLTAPETLDSLTRKIVDCRSRVPAAAAALDKLIEAYGRESVASVVDNVELASSHLNDADRVLEHARTVAAKPAGQQQGLVDDIRAVETTLQQVDMLLSGVEHADDTIRRAHADLPQLTASVRANVADARALKQSSPEVDLSDIDAAVDQATQALAVADGGADPLASYTGLLEASTQLASALAQARSTAADYSVQRQVFDQTMANAHAQLQAATDIINTRGSMVGSAARTSLATAKQHWSEAERLTDSNSIDAGITHARSAAMWGKQALDEATRDVRRYQNQNMSGFGGGGNGLVTGLILGNILSSSSRGGFGGGFGGDFGGGFGGDFGGGDWGFDSGSF